MQSLISRAVLLAAAIGTASAQDDYDNPCKSYGMDFQHRGTYFQNIASSEQFTFVSIFEGCQDDKAENILVDPKGDEVKCSDTRLRPDNVDQMSTCPIAKSGLSTGEWSVVIISNNGDADPIAYERDFKINAGTQATFISTPTATISITETPIVSQTTTETDTEIVTTTKVVTSPSVTKSPTVTKTPARVTTTTTKIQGTVTKHVYKVEPTYITKTKTQTCSIPKRQVQKDPTATITPTLVSAAALATNAARDVVRRVPADRAQRIAERKALLAESGELERRGLDLETITQIATTSQVVTSTTTAPASTITVVTEVTTTSTAVTTSTVYTGKTTLPVVTITAPTPTKTKTRKTHVTTTTTITKRPNVTVTVTTAPAASTAVCKAKGGKMV